jgi:hypothetical protein
MPSKRVSKKAKSTLDIYKSIIIADDIFSETSSFDNTFLAKDSNDTEKAERILWSDEIAEQLIKIVYTKWEEAPRACDNRIKRETWYKGADQAN